MRTGRGAKPRPVSYMRRARKFPRLAAQLRLLRDYAEPALFAAMRRDFGEAGAREARRYLFLAAAPRTVMLSTTSVHSARSGSAWWFAIRNVPPGLSARRTSAKAPSRSGQK